MIKINVTFTPIKHYDIDSVIQWIFYFRKYNYVKGFLLRIFGFYFNVREKNASKKLINRTLSFIKNKK